MKPYEERYCCQIPVNYDAEDVDFRRNGDRIKTIPYCERWRTPEDTIKYYEGIIKVIKKEFVTR